MKVKAATCLVGESPFEVVGDQFHQFLTAHSSRIAHDSVISMRQRLIRYSSMRQLGKMSFRRVCLRAMQQDDAPRQRTGLSGAAVGEAFGNRFRRLLTAQVIACVSHSILMLGQMAFQFPAHPRTGSVQQDPLISLRNPQSVTHFLGIPLLNVP